MANQEHLEILKQGVEVWNQWRQAHPEIRPDFIGANLNEENLSGSNLEWAEFQRANLIFANLSKADLHEARFQGAELHNTKFIEANLQGALINDARLPYAKLHRAKLNGAYLWGSDLRETDFSGADLSGANLMNTQLVRTNFRGATLSGCQIYGASAWDLQLDEQTIQKNLIITYYDQPTITVDDLEVAQFIYLLLNNKKIRNVIDTITSKVVLILGRFTPERKRVLDALRDELRHRNYSPVVFDFEKPTNRDITETVSTLAHMSRFILADLSMPRSIPQELQAIVPHLAVPVQPLMYGSKRAYGMFQDFKKYPWVLPVYRYTDLDSLLTSLKEKVIAPAELKAQELEKR